MSRTRRLVIGIVVWGCAACPTASGRRESVTAATSTPGAPSRSATPASAIDPGARLAVGGSHACVLDRAGQPICWGSNRQGQLGPVDVEQSLPRVVAGVRARAITADGSQTCVLGTGGELLCWGGQEPMRRPDAASTRARPVRKGSELFTQICAGFHSICGLTREGAATCWAERRSDDTQLRHPIEVAAPRQISAGWLGDTCVLDASAAVWCWRTDLEGRRDALERIDGLPRSTGISVGGRFGCAIGEDRVVRCWGWNGEGRRGLDPSEREDLVPNEVPGLAADVVQLAAGYGSSCVIREDATVACWGDNASGQLGRGLPLEAGGAAAVPGLRDIVEVDVGHSHACALARDDSVYCWGRASSHALGSGDDHSISARPTFVKHVESVRATAVSTWTNCALTRRGEIGCWNVGGASPSRFVDGVVGATHVALVSRGGCALVDRRPTCWGHGLPLDGRARFRQREYTAQKVPGSRELAAMASDRNTVCGLDLRGSVWCWGQAVPGGGSGTMVEFGPVQVKNVVDAKAVALAAGPVRCALSRSGDVSCWEGPDAKNAAVAKPIAGIHDAIALAAGGPTCVLRASNEVWCWNENRSATKAPVVLPEPATSIAIGLGHGCALLRSSQVACWGDNARGQLGNGTSGEAGIVQRLKDVVHIAAAGDRTCATRRDGSVACWGATDPAGRGAPEVVPTPVRVALPAATRNRG